MKNILKTVGKSILILAGSVFLGFFLLLLAFLVPVNQQNMMESYFMIESAGWYPSVQQGNGSYFDSFLPDVLDGGTDFLMLNTAAYKAQGETLPELVMYMSNAEGETYAYYWHGYVSILRPLLYLLNYGDIRMLNLLGQIALVLFFTASLWQYGKKYVFMFFSSYILLMPMALSLSLQFSWVFYVGMAGSLLLVRKHTFFKERYCYLFLLLGILTSYFDLLTYPLFTWGVPLLWWMVTDGDSLSCGKRLRQAACSGIFWLLGYASMWSAKWRLANFILKQDVYSLAMDEVHLRSGTKENAGYFLYERAVAIWQNWKHYSYLFYALILFAWFVWFLFHIIRGEYNRNQNAIVYALIGFSPVVWYYVLANHTTIHHFFTYRIYNISILAFMAIAVQCITAKDRTLEEKLRENEVWKKEKLQKNFQRKFLSVLGIAALAVISAGISLSVKEPLSVRNLRTWHPENDISINKGQTIEFSFVPSFPRIIRFAIGTKSRTDRSYEVSVLKDGDILYRERISHKGEYSDEDISVNWKLNAGEEYTIQLVLLEGEEVAVMMTDNSDMAEYAMTQTAAEKESQPVTNLSYYTRPQAKWMFLFLAFTWMGILCMLVFVFYVFADTLRTKSRRGKCGGQKYC